MAMEMVISKKNTRPMHCFVRSKDGATYSIKQIVSHFFDVEKIFFI